MNATKNALTRDSNELAFDQLLDQFDPQPFDIHRGPRGEKPHPFAQLGGTLDVFAANVDPPLVLLDRLAAVAALSGCQSMKRSLGLQRTVPDEFAVAAPAPLSVPPRFRPSCANASPAYPAIY